MANIYKDNYKEELQDILTYVNGVLGIKIQSENRTQEYVDGRTMYIRIANKTTKASRAEVGRHINRDHSTVTFGTRKLVPELIGKPKYDEMYNTYINIKLDNDVKHVDSVLTDGFANSLTEIIRLKALVKSILEEKAEKEDTFLTENEKAYRMLTDSEQNVYNERASIVLKSFAWKRKDDVKSNEYKEINKNRDSLLYLSDAKR